MGNGDGQAVQRVRLCLVDRLWRGGGGMVVAADEGVGVARSERESACPPVAAANAAIDIHTYKQHKLQLGASERAPPAYDSSCAGISATSMTLFAQQHN